MAKNTDNRRRAFADAVAIDAWHDDFSNGQTRVDLHADVVFGTARVGGEIDSPVRFRLSIKQAEVIVIIPENEPVSVDKESVSRDSPELSGRLTELIEGTSQANVEGAASTSISPTRLAGSVSAQIRAQASFSANKKLEVSTDVQMIVTQSTNADGHYRWLIQPRISTTLEGRPWNAKERPRLRLVDQRGDRSKGIPPTVRVEVRCRREDIAIEDLEVKDEIFGSPSSGEQGSRIGWLRLNRIFEIALLKRALK
jgi:hypothetical protein